MTGVARRVTTPHYAPLRTRYDARVRAGRFAAAVAVVVAVAAGVPAGAARVRAGTPGAPPPPPRAPPPAHADTRLPARGDEDGHAHDVAARVAAPQPDPAPLPVPPESRERITGTVRAADGAPLAGVRIVTRPEPPPATFPRRPLGADPTEQEAIAEARQRHRWYAATRATAVTADDGTYALEPLHDMGYWVFAVRDGLTIDRDLPPSDVRRQRSVRPGDVVDFVARASAKRTVRLVAPDGTEPADGQIVLECGGRRETTGWRSDFREVQVDTSAGVWTARAFSGDRRMASETVTLAEDGETTLRLHPRQGIAGRVTFAPGAEVPSAYVVLLRLRPGEPDAPDRAGADGWWTSAFAERGGAFGWFDIAAGRYLVGASYVSGRTPVVWTCATAGEWLAEQDLALPTPDAAQVLFVRVTDLGGVPLREAKIQAGFLPAGSSRWTDVSSSVSPRSDGVHAVFLAQRRSGGEARGVQIVRVEAPGWGVREVEWAPGDRQPVAVEMAEPARARLRVVQDPTGRALPPRIGLQICATPRSGQVVQVQEEWTGEPRGDVTEPYEFAAAQPGEYVLTVQCAGGGQWFRTVDERPITLRSGVNELEVPFPTLHSLTVHLPPSSAKRTLYIRNLAGNSASGDVVKSNPVVYEWLRPGKYQLDLATEGGLYASKAVEVPAEPEVRF